MPEIQIIEWKEIWKDDYLAWICGFANAQGGTLYIGKNDNGEIYCYLIQRRLLLPQWQYESEINRIGTGELFAP